MNPKFFSFAEMTRTSTGLPNAPSTWEQVANILATAQTLDVVRGLYGKPILVTSGFRSEAVNARVGGSGTSAHLQGLAADIKPASGQQADFRRILEILVVMAETRGVDQLIVYTTTGDSDGAIKWIHVGFRKDSSGNRGQVIWKR